MHKILLLIVLFVALFACENSPRKINFYHWSSEVPLDSTELSIANTFQSNKMYFRFFDVSGDYPIGTVKKISTNNFEGEIIPCIFITNNTFKNTDSLAIKELTFNVYRRIEDMFSYLKGNTLREIQFDCDWTESTRDNFFYFLQQFQKVNPEIEVSSTIRLHQLIGKYNVPPVNKGYLMVYNTSFFKEMNPKKNSILDNKEAEKYLKHLANFPIELDYALPSYSWIIRKSPYGFSLISENDKIDAFQKKRHKFKEIDSNIFVLKNNMQFEEFYVNDLDTLKYETITEENLKELISLIAKFEGKNKGDLIFYHIQSQLLKRMDYKKLNALRYE